MKKYITKEESKQRIIQSILDFKDKKGRYPATYDFENEPSLPSARTMQRRYGGIVKFKKEMGIKNSDNRKGKTRTNKAKEINDRNNKIQHTIIKVLERNFSARNVRQNFAPYEDNKINIDYVLYNPDQNKNEAIGFEMFYPSTKNNINGCLNVKTHKKQTLEEIIGFKTKFYFVVTNPEFTQKEIDKIMDNKKIPVKCTKVLSLQTFYDFCDGKIDLF